MYHFCNMELTPADARFHSTTCKRHWFDSKSSPSPGVTAWRRDNPSLKIHQPIRASRRGTRAIHPLPGDAHLDESPPSRVPLETFFSSSLPSDNYPSSPRVCRDSSSHSAINCSELFQLSRDFHRHRRRGPPLTGTRPQFNSFPLAGYNDSEGFMYIYRERKNEKKREML